MGINSVVTLGSAVTLPCLTPEPNWLLALGDAVLMSTDDHQACTGQGAIQAVVLTGDVLRKVVNYMHSTKHSVIAGGTPELIAPCYVTVSKDIEVGKRLEASHRMRGMLACHGSVLQSKLVVGM